MVQCIAVFSGNYSHYVVPGLHIPKQLTWGIIGRSMVNINIIKLENRLYLSS